MSDTPMTVTLSDGRRVELRPPTAGALRGIKLLDVLQLDAGAHADLLPRIADITALEFYRLGGADAMALMSEVVGFFAPAALDPTADPTAPNGSQPVSRMPTK